MSRGSFGRTVARAAASGGSKNYRARPPVLWYLLMVVIVVGGVALATYSRNERLHPVSASAAAGQPNKTDNWHVAFALDICGQMQPSLPANTNLSAAGLRTFGDGVIDVDPGAATDPSKFTGSNATLGNFVKTYGHNFSVSATSVRLPSSTKTYTSGQSCPGSSKTPGKATLVAKVWPSPTGTGKIVSGNPGSIPLKDRKSVV